MQSLAAGFDGTEFDNMDLANIGANYSSKGVGVRDDFVTIRC